MNEIDGNRYPVRTDAAPASESAGIDRRRSLGLGSAAEVSPRFQEGASI
ncbi:hypothetical protein [Xanthomonas graminis]|jgi:hypothetical protein|nr:hypothetical protein [Xanthomonas translucens]UKE55882.1 hypothetical protein KFS84_09495 [Xanthomonas translucens pv. graminis]WIH07168.1 hypothetical protein KM579_10865 [Xanthomonas translucens pv. graminis]WIH13761.1 hypothetical protein KM563_09290 [Xanthomonas translucens pv. graminis]WIH14554.1 hypothetical protein KM433_10805 [Xanthomonas translucens pv. graminis]